MPHGLQTIIHDKGIASSNDSGLPVRCDTVSLALENVAELYLVVHWASKRPGGTVAHSTLECRVIADTVAPDFVGFIA